MRASVSLLALVLLASATAVPRRAACEDVDRRLRARHHFEDAERDYRLGRFALALESYTKAYEHLPEPELLFNIAQCHRNLGMLERAIFFYRGYLREAKNTRNAARVEKLIAELEAKLEAQRIEQAELAKQKEPEPSTKLAVSVPSEPRKEVIRTEPLPPPPAHDDDSMPLWPWLLGAAVVVVASGAAIAAVATSGDDVPGDVNRDLLLDFRDR